MSSALNTPIKEKEKGAPASPPKKTPLAIERDDFIRSGVARGVRVLAEFEEFPHRLQNAGIRGTFLFFGSARSLSHDDYKTTVGLLEEKLTSPLASEDEKNAAKAKLQRMKGLEWMCHWWHQTHDLAKKLTEWSLSPAGVDIGRNVFSHWPNGQAAQPLVVCTGGGPGFMEAGNKGAAAVPGGQSMGVAVTLPFEAGLNSFVTDGLDFQFEYFFSRKFCEVYCAKAMICAPGGMGTCDEMFEVLTLMQTGHMRKIPVVLLGKKFWTDIINFKALADYHVISQAEVDAICFADTVEEAFDFVVKALEKEANELKAKREGAKTTPRPDAGPQALPKLGQ